jgi:peptide-methionine (S)-S-oxide reductase
MPLSARPARMAAALLIAVAAAAALTWQLPLRAEQATKLPAPSVDVPATHQVESETAVLAGGCFWGVQAVFQHVKGVSRAMSGYTGGSADTARYEIVTSGRSGHAEAVEITFDPREISYGRILQIFFSVAHDPTELNRQGPDVGPQYRSAIFYQSETQKRVAEAYVAQLGKAGVFPQPIVTRIDPLTRFYPAEAYHQDYAIRHPNHPYIVYNDLPKVDNLKRLFADRYNATPVTVMAAGAAVR